MSGFRFMLDLVNVLNRVVISMVVWLVTVIHEVEFGIVGSLVLVILQVIWILEPFIRLEEKKRRE